MMAVKKVLDLVAKFETIEPERVYPYYKRHGKMIKRSYPDIIYPDVWRELHKQISEQRIFKCDECGEMVSYFDLESWCCDFEKGGYICSCCYEEEMGEDL